MPTNAKLNNKNFQNRKLGTDQCYYKNVSK